jgi:hypothetical protein
VHHFPLRRLARQFLQRGCSGKVIMSPLAK